MTYTVNLEQINEYNTHKLTINPKRSALIVIEMQNVFRNDLNMISDKQLSNIKAIISASENAGVNIIYVRHNDSHEISKSMIDWWNGDKIEYGSEGWEMIDGFDTTGKTIIDKNQYSAFFKTELDEVLRANKIEDVIIVGVMTNCCCETTAREAFMYGYRVFFINDATSTFNEDLHLATLKNLSFGFACIQDTKHLVSDLIASKE
ncbi:isochorismatase [Legionella geestiana]|uniref:Isochorismatase n=1 Tax=Legionella geestiana TaxID=45065 RepID=A0A0W0U8J1_9GAMM|nr:isochorismatase family protein [Legionella geestiana]KTD03980.1 isochorismatase [Legionella geestiana]QBS12840.1 isochorismatase family protein [Legionella geestiana]STX54676.1 isochorismatase [Legionella geestiana]